MEETTSTPAPAENTAPAVEEKTTVETKPAEKTKFSDKVKGVLGSFGGNKEKDDPLKLAHENVSATPTAWQNIGSDEDLKKRQSLEHLFGSENGALDAFSKIDAYVYRYNDKAHDLYGNSGNRGIDDEQHVGPMAQDLAKNPVTQGTVHPDENGYLMVDTRQLTLTNTAMISQLARKVQELEERLGGR